MDRLSEQDVIDSDALRAHFAAKSEEEHLSVQTRVSGGGHLGSVQKQNKIIFFEGKNANFFHVEILNSVCTKVALVRFDTGARPIPPPLTLFEKEQEG